MAVHGTFILPEEQRKLPFRNGISKLWDRKKGSFIFCINYIPFSLFSFSFPLSSLSHPMSAIQFSVDRPFGVYLYDYFDMVYTAIVGKSANDFAFVEGETPLSTTPQGREPIVQDMT